MTRKPGKSGPGRMRERSGLSRLFCVGLIAFAALPLFAENAAKSGKPDLAGARKAFLAGQGKPDAASMLSSLADGLQPADALSLLAEFAPSIPDPPASKALLERGGRLALLLGDEEKAAALLEAAALRLPNGRDDGLLLLSARCRLACGDFDKASERASLILRATMDPSMAADARMVSAWALLFRGDRKGALSAASIQDPSGPSLEALFVAWAASPGPARLAAASALAKAYPDSPEAAIALALSPKSGDAAAPPAALRAGTAWAELSPLPQYYLSGFIAPASSPAAGEPKAGEPGSPPAGVETAESRAAASGQAQRYQIGIFSDPQNAADLVAELSKKGFKARTEKRTVKGRELLAVIVDGDSSTTLLKLKDAGYEAYQL